MDCEHLESKDITPWHGDVFDHPDYEYTCKLSGKSVFPPIHCKQSRCTNYIDRKGDG